VLTLGHCFSSVFRGPKRGFFCRLFSQSPPFRVFGERRCYPCPPPPDVPGCGSDPCGDWVWFTADCSVVFCFFVRGVRSRGFGWVLSKQCWACVGAPSFFPTTRVFPIGSLWPPPPGGRCRLRGRPTLLLSSGTGGGGVQCCPAPSTNLGIALVPPCWTGFRYWGVFFRGRRFLPYGPFLKDGVSWS